MTYRTKELIVMQEIIMTYPQLLIHIYIFNIYILNIYKYSIYIESSLNPESSWLVLEIWLHFAPNAWSWGSILLGESEYEWPKSNMKPLAQHEIKSLFMTLVLLNIFWKSYRSRENNLQMKKMRKIRKISWI